MSSVAEEADLLGALRTVASLAKRLKVVEAILSAVIPRPNMVNLKLALIPATAADAPIVVATLDLLL